MALLRAGELVAFPTETVYGLGADASNPAAVAKIFAAKGRPADHPVIVHLPAAEQLDAWARVVPDAARQLAAAFWPGPLTLILKRRPRVPDAVTGGQDTVGLRVPNHPLALDLLRAFEGGLAAPSANRFGRISPTSAAHVRDELGTAVALVLDGGPCRVGIESTIVDCSRERPAILRPGMIGAAEIGRALGIDRLAEAAADRPRVSGALESHYAPAAPLRLLAGGEIERELRLALRRGERVAVLAFDAPCLIDERLQWRMAAPDSATYARELYAALRTLDGACADLILVEAPPQGAQWLAIADRLARAAGGAGIASETRPCSP